MYFLLKSLSDELIYIRWSSIKEPDFQAQAVFIAELRRTLDESPAPLYFLSDLRKGRIQDIVVVQQLAALTKHVNWAGSAAFSENAISQMFVSNFNRLRRDGQRSNREIYRTPEEAIASLEAVKPGVATNIDWNVVLA